MTVSIPALAKPPVCVNIGTRSEGWEFGDGTVKFANCSDLVAYCGAQGSRSEGWYSAKVVEKKRLGFANCSRNQASKPKCVAVGTRSEGWKTPSGTILFDKCSTKVLACDLVGTRSEGWYAISVDTDSSKLLRWANCAGRRRR